MRKRRLDEILITKGLVKDSKEAFLAITEGKVFVGKQKAVSPAQFVYGYENIEIRAGRQYVGRGAYKLDAALEKFEIDVRGKICADIGAATGGFTEVLLKHGARKVYAIDTARGKLAPKLREDPRVVVMESIDVRDIKSLPDWAEVVTIDVSLIQLENILSRLESGRFLKPEGDVVALFKPQYETRDAKILRHGIIENESARKKLLEDFIRWTAEHGWKIMGQMESPIQGRKGNVEYLLWLRLF